MTKALFCFLLGITMMCGLSAQQALHFVYVDASEPLVNEDFFSDNEISSVLEFVGMHNQAMVYYCDGPSSRMFRGNDAQAQLSDAIYTQIPPQPDSRTDRKKIRDYLFNALEEFSGEVHLHFYYTDKQVKDLLAGSNYMPKLLPRELFAAGGTSISRMFVHLYYSDRPGKIDKEQVLANLSFYNTEFPPAIEFQITELN